MNMHMYIIQSKKLFIYLSVFLFLTQCTLAVLPAAASLKAITRAKNVPAIKLWTKTVNSTKPTTGSIILITLQKREHWGQSAEGPSSRTLPSLGYKQPIYMTCSRQLSEYSSPLNSGRILKQKLCSTNNLCPILLKLIYLVRFDLQWLYKLICMQFFLTSFVSSHY